MVHRWQEEALNRNQHHNKLSECLQKNCPVMANQSGMSTTTFATRSPCSTKLKEGIK